MIEYNFKYRSELQKLEAIQKSAMKSLEERYRLEQEQQQTLAKKD